MPQAAGTHGHMYRGPIRGGRADSRWGDRVEGSAACSGLLLYSFAASPVQALPRDPARS